MKAIFLDRDGVINKDPGGWTKHSYVTDWKDFQFLPGAIEALKLLSARRYEVIIISNQAGVGKGLFTKEELIGVNHRMLEEIAKKGGRIKDVLYCMHKKEDNCTCRKPNSGLLEKASHRHSINLRKTYFIGDSKVDVLAGKRVGCKTVFVLSGKMTIDELKKEGVRPDYVFKDLLEAVRWILEKEKRKARRAVNREYRKDKPDEEDTTDIRDGGDRAQESGDSAQEGI